MRELRIINAFLNWESQLPAADLAEVTPDTYKNIPVYAGGPTYGQVVRPADIVNILKRAEAKGYPPEIGIGDVPAMAIIRSVQTLHAEGLTYETLAAGSESEGNPVIDRIRKIAQRLATDPDYRSDMERSLRELMGE